MNSTLSHLPSRQTARASTTPPGASRRTTVSGSCISTIPVSSRTVTVQIVFEPDMAGYSVGSMMMKPASQSSRVAGTTRFTWQATLPRGSRSSAFRSPSPSSRRVCICSKTVAPSGGRTPPTMTLPISPPAWQPTTVIARRARIAGDDTTTSRRGGSLRGVPRSLGDRDHDAGSRHGADDPEHAAGREARGDLHGGRRLRAGRRPGRWRRLPGSPRCSQRPSPPSWRSSSPAPPTWSGWASRRLSARSAAARGSNPNWRGDH